MLKRVLIVSMAMNSVLLSNSGAIEQMWAAEQAPAGREESAPEPVYGSRLMTDEERAAYRSKMRAASGEGRSR